MAILKKLLVVVKVAVRVSVAPGARVAVQATAPVHNPLQLSNADPLSGVAVIVSSLLEGTEN